MKNSAARNLRAEQVNTIAPAPSGKGAEILALTEDDFFLLAVRRVVTLPNRVWHATSDAQAADMLMATPCAVVLLDVGLAGNVQDVVMRLRQQLPELGFVIAGEPQDRARVADLIESGDVQGFVVKDEAAANLAAVLETGINRHLELKTVADSRDAKAAGSRKMPLIAGIAAAVVAAVGVTVWFLTRDASAPAGDVAPLTSSVGSEQASKAETVETILQKGREAFEAGRFVDSKGNGALDHFKAALNVDPQNAEATDGVHRIAEVMLARAESALLESKVRDASSALKIARSVEPNHPRIPFLEAQVTRELDRSAAAQQEAAKADALNQKLASLIRLGNERMAQDRLVEPANDSARSVLMQARELDSGSVLVLQGLRSLANKMVQKGQQAASRGDAEAAEQWIAQARALNVSGIDFARIERDMKGAQRSKTSEADKLLGLARTRLTEGQLLDPENDSARFYVLQLRQQYPDTAGLAPVVDNLRNQLVSQASDAVARNDVRGAQRLLDEAKGLGASGASYDQASSALNVARRKIESMAAPMPVRDNMVVKSVTPEYPTRAQRKRQEGYVDLHFTSSTAGDVKDVMVAASQPEGVFDDAAVRALKRWKFKPREVDGQLIEQRLSLRMRFELQDE